jgi:cell division protein FtsQ
MDTPEESYVSTADETVWPAPAGALQRGYGLEPESEYSSPEPMEKPYVPRRGTKWQSVRMLLRTVGGRILLGSAVVLVLGVIAVAVAGVRYFLLHDERFLMTTSSDIQITGNEHLTRAQILSVFGADLERNLFRVSLAERRADLERLPWVQHATVMRLLPNQIRVKIIERVPVAFVRQGTQIGLVDGSGVLLDMPPEAAGDPKYSFPVLTGLAAADPLSTRAARMEIYKRFMAELDSTNEHLTRNLSEVDVSNPEDVKAVVTTGGSDILVHFGDEEFLNRYREFQEHVAEWKTQYPKLASADMRYEGQIVLEMQQGAGVPLAGDGVAAPVVDANATTNATANAADAKGSAEVAKGSATATTKADPSAAPQDDNKKKVKAKVVAKKAAAKKPVVKQAVAPAGAAVSE